MAAKTCVIDLSSGYENRISVSVNEFLRLTSSQTTERRLSLSVKKLTEKDIINICHELKSSEKCDDSYNDLPVGSPPGDGDRMCSLRENGGTDSVCDAGIFLWCEEESSLEKPNKTTDGQEEGFSRCGDEESQADNGLENSSECNGMSDSLCKQMSMDQSESTTKMERDHHSQQHIHSTDITVKMEIPEKINLSPKLEEISTWNISAVTPEFGHSDKEDSKTFHFGRDEFFPGSSDAISEESHADIGLKNSSEYTGMSDSCLQTANKTTDGQEEGFSRCGDEEFQADRGLENSSECTGMSDSLCTEYSSSEKMAMDQSESTTKEDRDRYSQQYMCKTDITIKMEIPSEQNPSSKLEEMSTWNISVVTPDSAHSYKEGTRTFHNENEELFPISPDRDKVDCSEKSIEGLEKSDQVHVPFQQNCGEEHVAEVPEEEKRENISLSYWKDFGLLGSSKNTMSCAKVLKSFFEKRKIRGKKIEFPLMRRVAAGWQCPICKSTVASYKSSVIHVIVAHGGADVKKFPCKICGMRFYKNYVLEKHIKTHSSERLYQCEHCVKAFKSQASLKLHIMTVHPGKRKTFSVEKGESQSKQNDQRLKCKQKSKLISKYELIMEWHEENGGNKCLEMREEVNGWGCPFCDMVYPTMAYCKRHVVMNHEVPCRHCRGTFKNIKELEQHFQKDHKNEGKKDKEIGQSDFKLFGMTGCSQATKACYKILKDFVKTSQEAGKEIVFPLLQSGGLGWQCPICKSHLSSYKISTWHMIRQHGGAEVKKFECKACEKRFFRDIDLQEHMITHATERPLKCEHCDKAFKTQVSVRAHTKAVHLGQEKTHLCPICGKLYLTQYALRQHVLMHSDKRDFVCGLCQQTFKNNRELNRHKRKIHKPRTCKFPPKAKEGPLECETCGGMYRSRSSLKKHKEIHSEIRRKYRCLQCGRQFLTAAGLKQHETTHTNERKYECSHCGKRFATSCNLTDHVRIHTGEKPYKCDLCGKAFAKASNLNTHKKGQHK